MKTARRVIVSGRVQGVFFRVWTADKARALGLDGWVRNRRDGGVEAVFHGPPDDLAAMIEACHQGPPSARVSAVDVLGEAEIPAAGFAIRDTR